MSEPSAKPVWSKLGLVRNAAWIAVALVAVVALGYSFYARREAAPSIGGEFALTDQSGKRVTNADLEGKILIVYFGFTHCPDSCPTTLQAIQAALGQLPQDVRDEVRPVFITLDPERDTPEVMADYVNGFIPGGLGLTGTADEIADAARKYRVAFQKVGDPKSSLPYTIDHASIVYLMDREGKFIRYYAMGMKPEELAAGLIEAVGKR
jgi:protein SCO1/2